MMINEYLHQTIIENLQKRLDALKAQEPIPDIGTPEYRALPHGEWVKQFEELNRQEQVAYAIALEAAPKDVRQLVNQIERQVRKLQHTELPSEKEAS